MGRDGTPVVYTGLRAGMREEFGGGEGHGGVNVSQEDGWEDGER